MVSFIDSWYEVLKNSDKNQDRKKKKPWYNIFIQPLDKNEGVIIVIISITTFILGFIGYSTYYHNQSEQVSVPNIIYEVLRLFSLEGSFTDNIPWTLNAARYLAVVIILYTGFKAALYIFYLQILRIRLRYLNNHIVVCGIGESGFELSKEYLTIGFQVVMIDLLDETSGLQFLKSNGGYFIHGDASDPAILNMSRVTRAKYVIVSVGNDEINLKITTLIGKLKLESSSDVMLKGFTHIEDYNNYTRLQKSHLLEKFDSEKFDVEFYNLDENRIRQLFLKYKLETMINNNELKITIIGEELFEPITVALARFMQFSTSIDLKIVLYSSQGKVVVSNLIEKYPNLEDFVKITSVELENFSHRFDIELFEDSHHLPNIIFITMLDSLKTFTTAKSLLSSAKASEMQIPIFMSIRDHSGFISILNKTEVYDGTGELLVDELPQVITFGMTEDVASRQVIIHEYLDVLARGFHKRYLEQVMSSNPQVALLPAFLPWERLSCEYKNANRYLADHITIKLRSLGLSIHQKQSSSHLFEFSELEAMDLAKAEHNRWVINKMLDGWKYGSERNDRKKLHPSMIPWEKLSESEKSKDYAMVTEIPLILDKNGYTIHRD